MPGDGYEEVCVLLPDADEIVTHTVPIGQFGPNRPFFGPDGELL